jgi:dTDP-4-amino-4,6-dideoxygalactose transaminase
LPVSAAVFTILGLEERDMLTSGGGALLYAGNRRDASVLRSIAPLQEYSLPDLNAAMAVVQFKEAARNLEKRREIAQAYIQSALRTRHTRFVSPEYSVSFPAGASDTGGGAEAAAGTAESPESATPEYNNYAFSLILETGMKDVKAYAKKKDIAVESAFEETLIGTIAPELCPEAYYLSLSTALFPLYPRLSSVDSGKVAKLILTLP